MTAHNVKWEELDFWTVGQLMKAGLPKDKLTGSGMIELIKEGLVSVSGDGQLVYKGKKVLAKRYTKNLLHYYIKVRDIVRNSDGSVTIVPMTDEYLDMLYITSRPDKNVLNEKEKLAVHMREVEKKTFKAIGEALGCSVSGAQAFYNRGAVKLDRAVRLEKYFKDHPEDRPGPAKTNVDTITNRRLDAERNIRALLEEALTVVGTGRGDGMLVSYEVDNETIVGSTVIATNVKTFRKKLDQINAMLDQLL